MVLKIAIATQEDKPEEVEFNNTCVFVRSDIRFNEEDGLWYFSEIQCNYNEYCAMLQKELIETKAMLKEQNQLLENLSYNLMSIQNNNPND